MSDFGSGTKEGSVHAQCFPDLVTSSSPPPIGDFRERKRTLGNFGKKTSWCTGDLTSGTAYLLLSMSTLLYAAIPHGTMKILGGDFYVRHRGTWGVNERGSDSDKQ